MIRVPVEHAVDPAWVPDAPLAPPGSNGGLLDVFRRRYLLSLLVRKEIQARYSGSFLGLFWSYVQPGVRFAMYYFVIGGILQLHKEVELFGIHIFAGRKRHKTYRQMKMHNDPTLNPYLYRAKAAH